jgi:hypothetical protein
VVIAVVVTGTVVVPVVDVVSVVVHREVQVEVRGRVMAVRHDPPPAVMYRRVSVVVPVGGHRGTGRAGQDSTDGEQGYDETSHWRNLLL